MVDRRWLLGGLLSGAALVAGVALFPGEASAQVVVIGGPRRHWGHGPGWHRGRRRCWWRHGRRVCSW